MFSDQLWNYYSMDNTKRLLGNRMKNIKKLVFRKLKKETLANYFSNYWFSFDQ
jgi:hypothetical protein